MFIKNVLVFSSANVDLVLQLGNACRCVFSIARLNLSLTLDIQHYIVTKLTPIRDIVCTNTRLGSKSESKSKGKNKSKGKTVTR